MKIQVISDIHLEFYQDDPEYQYKVFYENLLGTTNKTDTILCIAGDLGLFHRPNTWEEPLRVLSREYRAIICVAGNHEYYNNNALGDEKQLFAEKKFPNNVHYLFNESLIVEMVRFIGGTLWTSFYGKQPDAMKQAQARINDFRLIRNKDGSIFTPEATTNYHEISKSYIFDQINEAKAKKEKTVVISHHCISPQSVHHKYQGDILNAAFYSDLTQEISQNGPDLWIHGHTHCSFDYNIASTRIICNPFGYLGHEENPDFKFWLTVEI
jgi:predicted phosphodiesterase